MTDSVGADVVIVGGGTCGAVLAARLSEDPSRSVLLIEAGDPAPPIGPTPVHLLPIGPGSPRARSYTTTLAGPGAPGGPDATDLVINLVRGAGAGGSGAVNGAYFVRATPADLDGWDSGLWDYASVLPYFARSERDADFPAAAGHGDAGMLPVRRRPAAQWHPVTARFAEAARAAGFPEEADKNAGGPAGIGPVPCNAEAGLRVDPGSVYLGNAIGRPNLSVWTGATVRSVVTRSGAAAGVEVFGGGSVHLIRAESVVLAAGAIETPALLWRSGIGAPDVLGAATAYPLPGVGRAFSDHPEITIPYVPAVEGGVDRAPVLEVCLNIDDGPAGAVEIRPYTASFGAAIPGNPPMPPVLGVAMMAPRSRGTMRPDPADPWGPPIIEHRYLSEPGDAADARAAVDLGLDLLASSGIGTPVEGRPPRLGTSQHLSGTCPMGTDPETAVVDERCRVHGVEGLSIVDTSVFPRVPSRGPHATAVMLAERAAGFI